MLNTGKTMEQVIEILLVEDDKNMCEAFEFCIRNNKRFRLAAQTGRQSEGLELLRTGNLRAENGHPLSKELIRQQTIDPEKTVAIFLKLWTEGNFIKATFQGTNDARGEEFNKDLLCGFSPSWSLRALGTIQNTARGAEVKGIKVITWDRVIYPSHPRAYTDGIISESGNLISEGQNIIANERKPDIPR